MTPRYTAAPWWSEGPDMFGDFNIHCEGETAVVAAVVSNLRPESEVTANAVLVSLAPEMADVLLWIAAFADMRSKDDSKTFARVNRGALRTIAEKARAVFEESKSPQPFGQRRTV